MRHNMQENGDASFSEISKAIGEAWRAMPPYEKEVNYFRTVLRSAISLHSLLHPLQQLLDQAEEGM